MAASSSQNSTEIQELAQFAVEQHNHKENGALELLRVAKAEEQVVSGTMHHLTLEVMEAGKQMVYKAKVWVKPWIDFKEVVEFKYVSDLGVKRELFSWRSVPVDDPRLVKVADRALEAIQQKSDSLVQQLQILNAMAEVTEERAIYELLVKLRKGEKEVKTKISVYMDA